MWGATMTMNSSNSNKGEQNNWLEFTSSVRPPDCITISKTAIHLTKQYGKELLDTRLDILIDKKQRAIWLQHNHTDGTNKVRFDQKRKHYFIATSVSKELPMGWYQYQDPHGDRNGKIFKYLKPTPKRSNPK